MQVIAADAMAPTLGAAKTPVPEVGFAAGTVLGNRYEIRERLGAGGMGTVYAAVDRLLEHEVAVKFITPSLAADPRERARLRAEVKLAHALTHVNVARTYTLEEDDGHLFIVMELLRGKTLQRRLAEGRLPVDEAVRVARDLLAALRAAHARGIVHRDIKPANIKLCDDGRVVVMDFGIARLHEAPAVPADVRRFQSGAGAHATHSTIGGTPGYIAPEVVKGQKATARADLYALGVVLFEMLAGRPAFAAGKVLDLLLAPVDQAVPDLGSLVPDLPPRVLAVVRRLLAKEPAERYASADEVLRDLEETRPASTSRKRSAIIAAAAAVVIAAAGVIAYVATRPAEQPAAASGNRTAEPAPAPALNSADIAEPAPPPQPAVASPALPAPAPPAPAPPAPAPPAPTIEAAVVEPPAAAPTKSTGRRVRKSAPTRPDPAPATTTTPAEPSAVKKLQRKINLEE